MRQYVQSSSTDTQRDIHSTELGAISVCVCCRTVGKSSDLETLGRCVGDAWEMRGRCMGGAWGVHGPVHDGQQQLPWLYLLRRY